jgi:hypothetical protein
VVEVLKDQQDFITIPELITRVFTVLPGSYTQAQYVSVHRAVNVLSARGLIEARTYGIPREPGKASVQKRVRRNNVRVLPVKRDNCHVAKEPPVLEV